MTIEVTTSVNLPGDIAIDIFTKRGHIKFLPAMR